MTRQLLASPMLMPCFGDGSQSLLEQAVFGFFVVLFFIAVAINFTGSRKSLRAASVEWPSARRSTSIPRGRSLSSLWARCLWEFDILKSYLSETAGKLQSPSRWTEAARLAQPAASSTTVNDRRRWTRHPSNLHAVCWPAANAISRSWTARVRDISEGGVGLLAPCKLPLGAVIKLQLVSPNLVDQTPIQAEVMFMSQHSNHEWILGCEFLAALTPEQQQIYL